MRFAKSIALGFTVAAAMIAGCSDTGGKGAAGGPGPTPKADPKKSATNQAPHAHGKGPNGGVILDFGKNHAEFTVDHDAKECTILILNGDNQNAKPLGVASKELSVTTKETKTAEGKVVPPMTIKMIPQDESGGKASKFVGTDPGLGNVADFEGTVLGEIDGKPSQGTFKEE